MVLGMVFEVWGCGFKVFILSQFIVAKGHVCIIGRTTWIYGCSLFVLFQSIHVIFVEHQLVSSLLKSFCLGIDFVRRHRRIQVEQFQSDRAVDRIEPRAIELSITEEQ